MGCRLYTSVFYRIYRFSGFGLQLFGFYLKVFEILFQEVYPSLPILSSVLRQVPTLCGSHFSYMRMRRPPHLSFLFFGLYCQYRGIQVLLRNQLGGLFHKNEKLIPYLSSQKSNQNFRLLSYEVKFNL